MTNILTHSFPADFAGHLREVWDQLIGGQYTPPPRPSDLQLRCLLETTYFAGMETDEARRLQFTVCATPEESDVLPQGEAEPVELWPFTTDRELSVQEIRRLAAATHLDSSAIWVRFPTNEKEPLAIHGLVNFGSSWAYARKGYQYGYDQIPHALLLRAEGPGTLVAYQGQYRVAALVGGVMIKAQNPSIFDLLGAYPLLEEAHDLLRDGVVPPEYESAREWHQFEWIALVNAILAIVNTIELNGHGGALILSSQSCDLDQLLRIKYKLSEGANDLRQRFVHFLNLRHKHGDMVWPAQFKGGAPEVPAEALLLTRGELLESERRLAETYTFVANLSGTDGAIVIGTDLRIKGFGTEIILDKAKRSKVYEVRDPLGKTKEEYSGPRILDQAIS